MTAETVLPFDVASWPALRSTKTQRAARHCRLTPREIQVLQLVACGHTNRAIAAELGLSVNTVARHVENILNKLAVPGRAAAVALAVRSGVI
ncbi:MAG TPA: helix-turn-helix transcriptional regulator [Deinococcales bacterium]|nr:helix-turn-helix transcriptional regulator [Deinococcales bacterium]